MTALAAIHVSLALTVPVLATLFIAGGVYWRRLGRGSVPRPRRRLRRLGLAIGAVVGLVGLAALSIIDPDVRPTGYLFAWAMVSVLLLPAVLVAAADAIFTIRLHQRSLDRRLQRDAQRIRHELDAGATNEAADIGGSDPAP
jgi:Na+/proline symporter